MVACICGGLGEAAVIGGAALCSLLGWAWDRFVLTSRIKKCRKTCIHTDKCNNGGADG